MLNIYKRVKSPRFRLWPHRRGARLRLQRRYAYRRRLGSATVPPANAETSRWIRRSYSSFRHPFFDGGIDNLDHGLVLQINLPRPGQLAATGMDEDVNSWSGGRRLVGVKHAADLAVAQLQRTIQRETRKISMKTLIEWVRTGRRFG